MEEEHRSGQRAARVCLTCQAGKRRCDRQLPVCSRCTKLDRPCDYPAALPTEPEAPLMQSTEITQGVSASACVRCMMSKRKCDRILLKCSRCSRIGASCVYHSAIFRPLAPMGLGVAFNPPITYRSYMPQLIQFFLTSVALPSDTVVADSLAHHLRSEWMQHAMSDPCLFHATLFSASASIDVLRGQQNTTLTLYHQTWALRLINERLAQREPILTYGTLGAVIPLLYYNMVALDRESAVVHQKGLVKMLLATPRSFRAGIGPLIAIVKVTMLSFACIYDMLPIWDCLYSEAVRPNMLLRDIVFRTMRENDRPFYQRQTMDAILDMYEAVCRLDHLVHAEHNSISIEVARVLAFARTDKGTNPTEYDRQLDPAERINACCRLACQVFWRALRRAGRPEPGENIDDDVEARQILKHTLQLNPLYWIRYAPEVFTWVVFTGAAGSSIQTDRVAFISHAGTVLTAVDDERLLLTRQGWRYFRLLRRLGGYGEPFAAPGDSML
ncbi:hypothetical protein BDV10DRAFT_203805 [Aspergillus recurvatus]